MGHPCIRDYVFLPGIEVYRYHLQGLEMILRLHDLPTNGGHVFDHRIKS